ncbi:MAG: hypothetical protein ACE5LU_11040 [Anaerolineae bacterium]
MKRLWPAIVLLLLVALSVTGCGGRSTTDILEGITARAADVVARYMPQINLPRITVAYDETGDPTIFRMKASTLPDFVGLSVLQLSPNTIQWLMERNVQHVELDVSDAGLFIYVNGKAMPYLAWNRGSLANAGELLDRLDLVQYDTTIAKAAPLLGRLGTDVLIKFPVQAGVKPIPVRDRSQRVLAEPLPLEKPTAIIHGMIKYSDDGVPSIAGITSREIGQLAVADLHSVELTASQLALVKSAGVHQARGYTRPDGLHVVVNEREVAHVAYNEKHLMNAIDLYAQLFADDQVEVLATFMRNLAPDVYGADIDVVVEFPTNQ